MEQKDALVSVCYKSLLEKKCELFGFPEPIFNQSPLQLEGSHAVVCRKKPNLFVCLGDEDGNPEDSIETTARKMVFFLVHKYKVRVNDVNLDIWESYKSVALDFKLRREQLECVEKGKRSLPLDEQLDCTSGTSLPLTVSIDFYSVLESVVSKFQVYVTPIEFLQYAVNDYKAYMSIYFPCAVPMVKWMESEWCVSIVNAKQSLAKRVIPFLGPVCKFQVDDVNFYEVQRTAVFLELERESCLCVKERIYGVREDFDAKPILTEEMPHTPKGEEFVIPQPDILLNAPKKRLFACTSRCFF